MSLSKPFPFPYLVLQFLIADTDAEPAVHEPEKSEKKKGLGESTFNEKIT